jgi:coenzyme PQQ synthesis protein D (PqqD)
VKDGSGNWRNEFRQIMGRAMSNIVYERATELLEADLGAELMALDVEAGTCFGFNSVATDVWRRLASPASFAELKDALLSEYEVSAEQCSSELRDLMANMIEMGLVRETSAQHIQDN